MTTKSSINVNRLSLAGSARMIGALALAGALVWAASPAWAAPAGGDVAPPDAMGGGQDTIACAENSGTPIYTNSGSAAVTVTLAYEHGCSAGLLTPGLKATDGASSWIKGCEGITNKDAQCKVSVPAGSSIWMYQTLGKDATGSGHTWRVEE